MYDKGQITKHEWVNWRSVALGEAQENCKHCSCIKVWDAIEGIMYKKTAEDGYPLLLEEPPCITRKIEPDGNDHSTRLGDS